MLMTTYNGRKKRKGNMSKDIYTTVTISKTEDWTKIAALKFLSLKVKVRPSYDSSMCYFCLTALT